jgi:hypothetical protein
VITESATWEAQRPFLDTVREPLYYRKNTLQYILRKIAQDQNLTVMQVFERCAMTHEAIPNGPLYREVVTVRFPIVEG